MLTKEDIFAIRHADNIVVHLGTRNPQGLVYLIKNKSFNPKPFEQEQQHVLASAKVTIETYPGRAALEAGAAQCFAMAGIYHAQGCPVSSILKTLRVGDEVTFSFYPDCHSNQYVTEAGLHADCLYLHVRRGDKRHTFELDQSICPDNSARMCRGIPAKRRITEEA